MSAVTAPLAELRPRERAPVSPDLRRELDAPPPWMYPWPLRDGTAAPIYSDELGTVHETRVEMIEPVVRAALAAAGPEARVLDLGCNEGLFAHLARAWGAGEVVGCDIRERNIVRAEAIRDHYGISSEELEFRCADVLALDPDEIGTFDVVLCLGLIYHLENPVGGLRMASQLAAPGGLCVVESQLTRQSEPIVHGWGARDEWQRAEGSFAVLYEDDPDHPLASVGGLISLLPNVAALELAMRVAGFARVRWLDAAPHHNPQYVLRDRGILMGRAPRGDGGPMIDILTTSAWQMTEGERAALEGVLSQLRPRLSIEIGTAEGGSLRRIARHSEWVHSFDLVAPDPAVQALDNVTLHTGDSHVLLPQKLAELAAEGKSVDFVLVDGDHSADGLERDVRDLLASEAIRRTVIVLHDTLNDEVREGLLRIDFGAHPRVAYANLDLVGGHLSHGGPFHHQLWGGLGLVVVDDSGEDLRPHPHVALYDLYELLAPARDALVARERAGSPVGPGTVVEAVGDTERLRGELAGARTALAQATTDLGRARDALAAIQGSPSWRVTAPLRAAKRLVRARGS